MCGGALSNFVCPEGGGIGENVLVLRVDGSKEECSQAPSDENVWNSPCNQLTAWVPPMVEV